MPTQEPARRSFSMRPRLPLLVPIALLAAAALGARSPAQDGADAAAHRRMLGTRLEPKVTNLQPLRLEPSARTLELIERLSRVETARLKRAQLYFGDGPEEMGRRIVTLPLAGAMQGASIVLAIDDEGLLTDGTLWGRPDVNEDEHRTWRRLVEQFVWREIRIRNPKRVDGTFDPDEYWRELSEDQGDEARWAMLLYEIRRMMVNNSDFYQRVERAIARKEAPPEEWFQSYLDSMDRLGELGREMRPFIGQAASSKFEDSAQETRAVIEEMASATGADRTQAVFEPFSAMEGACFGCHSIRDHGLGWDGPLVFPGIDSRLTEFGLRADLFRVGMDVWSPAGEEEAARQIADAVQAALLLVGSAE